MAGNISESAPGVEGVSSGQVTALRRYGARLFLSAAQPFGGLSGVGSVRQLPLNRARYLAPDSGQLFTIAVSGIEDEEASKGALTVAVETPAPRSVRWPNAHVEERFVTGAVNVRGFDYVLGVGEYTPEGERVNALRSAGELRKDYPDMMEDFPPDCTSDRFMDRLLTVAGLSPADEVGCDPNPYRLI